MKQIVIFFFIWLLLASIGFGIGHLVFNTSGLHDFVENGVSVYGKVTAKEPDNHQIIRYSYNVSGKEYNGAGNAGRGNPAFEQIQIGQQIVVFYKLEAPEESILGYPQMYSKSNDSGILFTTIFFPLFPMVVIYFLYRVILSKK